MPTLAARVEALEGDNFKLKADVVKLKRRERKTSKRLRSLIRTLRAAVKNKVLPRRFMMQIDAEHTASESEYEPEP